MQDCTYYKMNDYIQSNHHWAATFFFRFIPLSLQTCLLLFLCVLICINFCGFEKFVRILIKH
jgi:hypothetical protein